MEDQNNALDQREMFGQENVEQRHAYAERHCQQCSVPPLRVVCVRIVQDNETLDHCASHIGTDCRANLIPEDTAPSDEIREEFLDPRGSKLRYPVILPT